MLVSTTVTAAHYYFENETMMKQWNIHGGNTRHSCCEYLSPWLHFWSSPWLVHPTHLLQHQSASQIHRPHSVTTRFVSFVSFRVQPPPPKRYKETKPAVGLQQQQKVAGDGWVTALTNPALQRHVCERGLARAGNTTMEAHWLSRPIKRLSLVFRTGCQQPKVEASPFLYTWHQRRRHVIWTSSLMILARMS